MRIGDEEMIRVLIVDDETDFAEMVATFLERANSDIAAAAEASAEDALDRLADGGVDCVVTDYRMPDIDGIEFLETVRQRYPNTPCILFTAHGSEEVASEAISAGVDDYMQKTGGTDQYEVLANRIHNLVNQSHAETSYHEIFDKATVGLVVHDRESGEILNVNQRYCELLGYSKEEAFRLTLGDICSGEDGYTEQRARELVRRTESDEVRRFEWLGETKSGERIWVEVSLRLAEIGGEERVLASVRDVTEQRERERRLSALHDATQDLEDATTEEQVLEVGVEAAESMLDLDIAAFYGLGEDDTRLEPRAVTSGAEELFGTVPPIEGRDAIAWSVFETGEAVVTDDVHQHPEVYNPDTPVRSEIILPVDEHGVFLAASTEPGAFEAADESLARILVSNVEAAIGRARREMLLREREEALLRQNERLDEFASVVSHDLRNPLNVAEGHLDLLADECDSQHVEQIANALGRMSELVEDVLSLARDGQVIDDPQRVSLRSTIETAVANTDLESGSVIVEGDLPVVEGDPERLAALFENLLRNAVEHGGEGDFEVRIGTTETGIYVADDGRGIPEDEREAVFEVAYSTAEDGTGFGLSIVQSIVQAHGWEIDVTESSDGGTRFEITGMRA